MNIITIFAQTTDENGVVATDTPVVFKEGEGTTPYDIAADIYYYGTVHAKYAYVYPDKGESSIVSALIQKIGTTGAVLESKFINRVSSAAVIE